MKIVVDDKIPFIREAIAQISTDVIYKPGIAISPDDIHDYQNPHSLRRNPSERE